MARLCLGMYHQRKEKKTPLAWVNLCIFNYERTMRRKMTLHMWDMNGQQPTHDLLNPLRNKRNFTFKVSQSE
jgi:hypothetical protein